MTDKQDKLLLIVAKLIHKQTMGGVETWGDLKSQPKWKEEFLQNAKEVLAKVIKHYKYDDPKYDPQAEKFSWYSEHGWLPPAEVEKLKESLKKEWQQAVGIASQQGYETGIDVGEDKERERILEIIKTKAWQGHRTAEGFDPLKGYLLSEGDIQALKGK